MPCPPSVISRFCARVRFGLRLRSHRAVALSTIIGLTTLALAAVSATVVASPGTAAGNQSQADAAELLPSSALGSTANLESGLDLESALRVAPAAEPDRQAGSASGAIAHPLFVPPPRARSGGIFPVLTDGSYRPDQSYVDVGVFDNYFEPKTVTVTLGTIVRWTNRGTSIHSVTSDTGEFEWTLVPGAQYRLWFLKLGTFPYHCRFHPEMTGTVVVVPGGMGTPTPTPIAGPTLAPGRGAIVYSNYPPLAVRTDLYVINPDGSGGRRVTNTGTMHEAQPCWSPDHTQIAYTSGASDPGQAPWGLHIADATTGQPRQLTSGPAHYEPDWRPDGSHIAFTSVTELGALTRSSINVMTPGGGAYRLLVYLDSTSYVIANPDWSPDASRMVFTVRSDRTGGDLYAMNADGTGIAPILSRGGWDDIDPVWSPDGKYLAFASGINRGSVERTEHDIWLLDIATGNVGTVAQVPGWDLRRPSWSPDGQHIVFHARVAQTTWALYIVPATGGPVTGPVTAGFEPDWGASSIAPVPTAPPTLATPVVPPPFPTLPTPGASPTQGSLPTFPPPATFTPELTPTPAATGTPTPIATFTATSTSPAPSATAVDGVHAYFPYLAKNAYGRAPTPTPPAPSCLQSEMEPNNTLDAANDNPPLCRGLTVLGALPAGDPEDLYRVEITSPSVLEADLRMSGLPDGTDYDLLLYRSGYIEPVAESRRRGPENESLEATVVTDRYYLRVVPATGSARSGKAYRLGYSER